MHAADRIPGIDVPDRDMSPRSPARRGDLGSLGGGKGRGASGSVAIKTLFGLLLVACALLPLGRAASSHLVSPAGETAPVATSTEWPREWEGRALRPLALGAVEERFAARFPGRIARLTDGQSVLVWREAQKPTRMLHPAADCYRGLGYRIEQARLERDADARLWRCFIAERDGVRLRVCERIVDADGQTFTDASSWYWAAQLGSSRGPWQAVTTARPL